MLSCNRNRKRTKTNVSFLIGLLFWNKPFSGFLELHNFESSNFLTRCEYIEKKTPLKNILEFLKHFSSRSHHKLFFGPPCIYLCIYLYIHYIYIYISIIYIYVYNIYLYIYISIYLYIYISIYLYIYISIYLYIYISIYLYISIYIYISIYLSV